jgi:rRNA maturation endonuclease Nob1
MQGSDLGQKQKSPCSTKSDPSPEFIACVKCGHEIEIWTDENETICHACGHKVFKKEAIVH